MLARAKRSIDGRMIIRAASTESHLGLAQVVALAVLTLCCGCSICSSPYDCDYGTYGSRTPRTDMRHGRVGSIFSDPALVGSSAGQNLVSDDQLVVEEIDDMVTEYGNEDEYPGVVIGEPN